MLGNRLQVASLVSAVVAFIARPGAAAAALPQTTPPVGVDDEEWETFLMAVVT